MNNSNSVVIGLSVGLAAVLGYLIYLYQGPMHELTRDKRALEQEINQLRERSIQLSEGQQSTIEQHREQIAGLQQRLAQSQDSFNQEVAANRKAQQALQDQANDLGQARARIAEVSAQLSEARAQSTQISEDLASSTQMLDDLRQEREALRDETAGQRERLRTLESEYRQQQQRLVQAESSMATLEATKNRLEGELELARQTSHKDQQAAQARIVEISRELTEAQTQVDRISSDLTQRDTQLTETRKQQKALRQRMSALEDEKHELRRLQQALNSQLGMTQDQIAALSKDAESMGAQLKNKERQIQTLKTAQQDLQKNFQQQISEKEIEIENLADKLNIRLMDQVLFASGSSDISAAGRKLLAGVAQDLKKVEGYEITVAGHTDNIALGEKSRVIYIDNLGLSIARAAAVSRALRDNGVAPEILSAAGHSMYHPVTSNDSVVGRRQNRRVEILLEPMRTP
jgi:chemotaxis protein MotB